MAPRASKVHKPALPDKTLVLDHGAYSLKAGLVAALAKSEQNERVANAPDTAEGEGVRSSEAPSSCMVIPNCLGKTPRNQVLVGSQLDSWTDFAEMTFRRPMQKGNLVSWEAEKQIWDHEFFETGAPLACDPHETNLLLAEAPCSLPTLQTNCDQMVFEEFEFAAYRRCVGPALNAYHDMASLFQDPANPSPRPPSPVEGLLVIDSGYSHTTVTPLHQGRPIQQAAQRLDVGGKLLTNHLKETLSIRQVDIRAEPHMASRMKEDACFVSRDFAADLERVKRAPRTSGIVADYVLPDYARRPRGALRAHDPLAWKQMRAMGYVPGAGGDGDREAFLKLGAERFAGPELFFHPKDVGVNQPGLAETVMRSLTKVPTGLWQIMLANVYVVGGNALLPGFVDRLYDELRQLAPVECMVRVAKASDPIKSTWQGGAKLCANAASLKEVMVTRQDYLEHGSSWLHAKFAGGAAS